MSFGKLSEITKIAEKKGCPFWQIIIEDDMKERNVSCAESFGTMEKMFRAMKDADLSYDASLRSASGLSGGDGAKLEAFRKQPNRLVGDFITEVMEKAVKMGESNACMKRIVAAPTAGSCGIIPAVILTYLEQKECGEEKIIQARYVAAGIGEVIASAASISGAEGGCQAEIGAASSMAAGALVYLQGGDCTQIATAAAMAMKNLLGLVCDPVAGLVEVPCVKRNVIGTVNAMSAADMAMAGITSRIPPDQVMDAMKEVGDKMDASLRETALGGLAHTEEGMKIAEKMYSSHKNC